jgi:hypothetical protein
LLPLLLLLLLRLLLLASKPCSCSPLGWLPLLLLLLLDTKHLLPQHLQQRSCSPLEYCCLSCCCGHQATAYSYCHCLCCHAHRWVAAANHDELGRVSNADAFALDCVDAAGTAVQHNIHQAVIKQVDLIDVQDAAVGACLL